MKLIRLSGLNISGDDTDHPTYYQGGLLCSQPVCRYIYTTTTIISSTTLHGRPLKGVAAALKTTTGVAFSSCVAWLETVKKLRWDPQKLFIAPGWISALVPLVSQEPILR